MKQKVAEALVHISRIELKLMSAHTAASLETLTGRLREAIAIVSESSQASPPATGIAARILLAEALHRSDCESEARRQLKAAREELNLNNAIANAPNRDFLTKEIARVQKVLSSKNAKD